MRRLPFLACLLAVPLLLLTGCATIEPDRVVLSTEYDRDLDPRRQSELKLKASAVYDLHPDR